MPQSRYLTKSKFKLAMECPTKLHYVDKKDVYVNTGFDDPFLKQLAIGGFQVGELARQYFPGGEHVLTKNYSSAVEVTNALLERDSVTIFEAAFQHANLFIRADILVKNGNTIDLIEVKAKSCSWVDESGFRSVRERTIFPEWLPHIQDVAFQRHVINLSRPEFDVRAHLMLADKTVVAATDGLNQKFRAAHDSTGARYVELRGDLSPEDLSVRLLRIINVDGCCNDVYQADYNTLTFPTHVDWLANRYSRDERIATPPSVACKACEFRIKEASETTLKCGYRECWSDSLGWSDDDFDDATVLDIWDFKKKQDLIDASKIKMRDVTLDDIDPNPKPGKKPGLTRAARRWLQIRRTVDRDDTIFFDREGLANEMKTWEYPLHFIDFETAMPVIPFKAGRRPYEGIAFQFSHHTVDQNGDVKHVGQFLETTPGTFPNYDFTRELKRQLENDGGSIFRYHSHENSYLALIRGQLLRDQTDIPDRDELIGFIESTSKPRGFRDHPEDDWEAGPRCMIDLYDLVLRYYYDPRMRDSNSIKKVLPATLNNSDLLKAKYSQPIYGTVGGIQSLNFTDGEQWVVFDDRGDVIDPYHSLAGVFDGIDLTQNDFNALMSGIDDINDGGAAMAAYGKLQYEDMTVLERDHLNTALLKYCELDTLAMVMIYEAWKALL